MSFPQVKREVLMVPSSPTSKRDATIYSDELADYKSLGSMEFMHETVNHVTEYVRGQRPYSGN